MELPSTLVFEAPTIRQLAAFFKVETKSKAPPKQAAAGKRAAAAAPIVEVVPAFTVDGISQL
eukprot:4599908-Prymnesium_polylepis.1